MESAQYFEEEDNDVDIRELASAARGMGGGVTVVDREEIEEVRGRPQVSKSWNVIVGGQEKDRFDKEVANLHASKDLLEKMDRKVGDKYLLIENRQMKYLLL